MVELFNGLERNGAEVWTRGGSRASWEPHVAALFTTG